MNAKIVSTLAAVFLVTSVAQAQYDPDLLAGMKARSIGPAAVGGRIVAIDALESDPDVIYVGAATGGLWKSVDGGTTFKPLFDDQPVAAIGAVAVNQRNPDIVWVGTGEASVRNSASVGNGVYRSLDGGNTWQHLGLDKSERIARVVLHPTNRDVAWVAATGPEWGETTERGVFKTEDGGRTWKKVLYVNERTGAADLIIDPSNPDKLYAAMWDFRRWPWFFRSGGPGSGLHISTDGGTTWKRVTEDDGFPKGQLGRIGLSISRSNPQIVYALVEAAKSALVRSDDGGRNWKIVNDQSDVVQRPFYFSNFRVDPNNPLRLYNLATFLSLSEDGGKSFRTLPAKVHPDHHAMWIDPHNSDFIIDGNDGGVSISRDGGRTWRFVESLPLAQFYHVATDNEVPYNIYGGLQDNGSWRGPSAVWERGPIQNHHWQEVDFGDGFATTALSNDATTGYAMSQSGYIIRWNLKTGERKDVRPPQPEGTKLRFNWNSAIALDPFDADTVYYGSQFVHRSSDRGEHWTTISPDLTTNNKAWQQQEKTGGLTIDASGAEMFTTIISIAPSPREKGTMWVGTDDGRVQLTRDGGTTWNSVEGNIKGVARNSWVPHIEASRFDPATAYVIFDDHRRTNWTPYVMKTSDYGKTWKNLATSDVNGYALTLVEDSVDRNLLFLGTEFGLFVSTDGGSRWMKWKYGVPTVSVMALTMQSRENDLVIGTHGRSLYVLDDVSPLRQVDATLLKKPIHLFDVPDSVQYISAQPAGARFRGDTPFAGENKPYGATFTFSLNAPGLPIQDEKRERERKEKERETARKPLPITVEGVPQEMIEEGKPKQELPQAAPKPADDKGAQAEIEIKDESGAVIRTFKVPAKLGLNRATWDLRRDPFKQLPREREPDDDEPSGPAALPGTYTATVRFGGQEASAKLRVVDDPRISISAADRKAKFDAIVRAGKLQETLGEALTRLQRTRADIDTIVTRANAALTEAEKKSEKKTPLAEAAEALKTKVEVMEKKLWQPPKSPGILPETDVNSAIGEIQYLLSSSTSAPTEAQLRYLAQAEAKLRAGLAEFNQLYANDVTKFRALVSSRELLADEKPVELGQSKRWRAGL
jgi:photosystem II stability/assembly factor-like uncharacterized protein